MRIISAGLLVFTATLTTTFSAALSSDKSIEKKLVHSTANPLSAWSEEAFILARPQKIPIVEGSVKAMIAKGRAENRTLLESKVEGSNKPSSYGQIWCIGD